MEAICASTPRWRPQRRRPPAGPDMSSSVLFFLHMCKMWKIIWIKAVIAHSPRWRPQSASGWSILTGEGADGSSQPRVELTLTGQFPKFWRGLSCQSVLPGKQTNIRHVEQQLRPTTFWESTWSKNTRKYDHFDHMIIWMTLPGWCLAHWSCPAGHIGRQSRTKGLIPRRMRGCRSRACFVCTGTVKDIITTVQLLSISKVK